MDLSSGEFVLTPEDTSARQTDKERVFASSTKHLPAQTESSARGSIAFYLLCVLPLVFSFSVFSIDLSRYYLLRQKTQETADRIALDAARYLPNQELAAAHVYRQVAGLSELQLSRSEDGQPHTVVSDSRISLRLRGSVKPLLASFIPHPGFKELEFSVEESSSVQTVPADVVLLFADGAAVAPVSSALNGAAWGNPLEWPASPTLSGLAFACSSVSDSCPALSAEAQRLVTQRCFNPQFSAIKMAIIDVLRLFRASMNNRLAVLSTPGSSIDRGFDSLTDYIAPSTGLRPTSWSPWQHSIEGYSDDLCVYLSDDSLVHSNGYQPPTGVSSAGYCSPFEGRFPQVFVPHGSIQNCYFEAMGLEERIWLHAARELPSSTRSAELAISESIRRLVSPSTIAEERGRLDARANKIIIAVLDTAPDLSGELLESVARFGIQLFIFVHQDTATGQPPEFYEATRQQIARIRQRSFSGLYLAQSASSTELRRLISQIMLSSNREVVVSS